MQDNSRPIYDKTDVTYFGLKAARTERLAISQDEAANNCNQSPLELIP